MNTHEQYHEGQNEERASGLSEYYIRRADPHAVSGGRLQAKAIGTAGATVHATLILERAKPTQQPT